MVNIINLSILLVLGLGCQLKSRKKNPAAPKQHDHSPAAKEQKVITQDTTLPAVIINKKVVGTQDTIKLKLKPQPKTAPTTLIQKKPQIATHLEYAVCDQKGTCYPDKKNPGVWWPSDEKTIGNPAAIRSHKAQVTVNMRACNEQGGTKPKFCGKWQEMTNIELKATDFSLAGKIMAASFRKLDLLESASLALAAELKTQAQMIATQTVQETSLSTKQQALFQSTR